MKKPKYFIVYWAGSPVYQTTDELAAHAYANTYNSAIVKQSNTPIL